MRSFRVVAGVCMVGLASSASAWAQQSRSAGADELNAAVVTRAEAVDQERAQLRALLARPEVRDVARAHGLDLGRAQSAAGTLSTTELQQISPLVQTVTTQLNSGGVVTISTTTIILILLVIILLVLIA